MRRSAGGEGEAGKQDVGSKPGGVKTTTKKRRQKSIARPRSHTQLTSNRDQVPEAEAGPRAGSPTSGGQNLPAAQE